MTNSINSSTSPDYMLEMMTNLTTEEKHALRVLASVPLSDNPCQKSSPIAVWQPRSTDTLGCKPKDLDEIMESLKSKELIDTRTMDFYPSDWNDKIEQYYHDAGDFVLRDEMHICLTSTGYIAAYMTDTTTQSIYDGMYTDPKCAKDAVFVYLMSKVAEARHKHATTKIAVEQITELKAKIAEVTKCLHTIVAHSENVNIVDDQAYTALSVIAGSPYQYVSPVS